MDNNQPDLQHIDIDEDGVVSLRLYRKETLKALWESMQQFKPEKDDEINFELY